MIKWLRKNQNFNLFRSHWLPMPSKPQLRFLVVLKCAFYLKIRAKVNWQHKTQHVRFKMDFHSKRTLFEASKVRKFNFCDLAANKNCLESKKRIRRENLIFFPKVFLLIWKSSQSRSQQSKFGIFGPSGIFQKSRVRFWDLGLRLLRPTQRAFIWLIFFLQKKRILT